MQRLLFAMLQPGLPLRVEVKAAVYFGPLNQRTYHTVIPRIELGLKISALFDGYWRKDERGYVRHVASLENALVPVTIGEYLEVYIDLQHKTFTEVQEFYQVLVNDRRLFINQCTLP